MKTKFTATLTLALILAILCTALLPTGVAFATQYGSVDTSNEEVFWYYGENYLNIAGMKGSISKWIGNADKNNPVVIGVIDTGLNHTHEVFTKTNTLYKVDGQTQGYNAYVASTASGIKNPTAEQLSNVVDQSTGSHGTAVASIIAMMIYELGLQDYIKIYPIKASREDTRNFPDVAVAKALEHINETQDTIGIDVANLAFCGYVAIDYFRHRNLFLTTSEDCVIVAAAGNDKYNSTLMPSFPATLDGVLSVAGYSEGGLKYDNSNFGKDYDLCAPAVNIYTAKGASDSYSATEAGTSMASAFVSVVSAIVTLREETAKSGVNSTVIARHIRTASAKNTIDLYGVSMPRFEAYDSVNNEISETYLEVAGISMSNDRELESNCTIHRGQFESITFAAELLPYGNTNPESANNIEWTRTEILSRPILGEDGKETGSYEQYDGKTEKLGKGKAMTITPDVRGTYRIEATFTNNAETFSVEFVYNLTYVAYSSIAGSVKVTPISSPEDSEMGEVKGKVFTGDQVEFTLTNMEGVDPSVDIDWYVNGVYAGTGTTFNYTAEKEGEFVVTAQYGDYRYVEKVYTLEVRSTFYKPATYGSVIAVGGLLLVGVAIAVILAKKKNG